MNGRPHAAAARGLISRGVRPAVSWHPSCARGKGNGAGVVIPRRRLLIVRFARMGGSSPHSSK